MTWHQAEMNSQGSSGFTAHSARTPQMYVDVDRECAKAMGVPLDEVFLTLQLYLGGYYTNDFNQFGRTWQVNLQGDPDFRLTPDQVRQLRVRNSGGEMVPLGSIAEISATGGPALVVRYNGVTAAAVNGGSLPGVSSGTVIKTVEDVAERVLPQGMNLQWTELTLLQIRAGNTAIVVFALAVVLVFLVLAAQYESLSLPLAVILVVPMCLLCSTVGVAMAGMDINIFVQIGFIVLVGLASKNAILIVEFAKEKSARGVPPREATVDACRLRLRPIIMTSLAFILGVVPLALAVGAGAEMRRTLGHCGLLRHAGRDVVRHPADPRLLLPHRAHLSDRQVRLPRTTTYRLNQLLRPRRWGTANPRRRSRAAPVVLSHESVKGG